MKIVKAFAHVTSFAAVLLASHTVAADMQVSGKKNLVCASHDVIACTDGPVCMQGTANTFELPVFMFIDFKAREIRAVEGDGSSFASPVTTHEVTEQSIIMQGYENHHGWTLAIDRMDGGFTVSSTGPEVNYMMMGACTAGL